MTKQPCEKCNKKSDLLTYRASGVVLHLCPTCLNEWLSKRDAAVNAAFCEWTKSK
jgi:uncharacterized Zn ribbon protein